jgi:hypothetical protein
MGHIVEVEHWWTWVDDERGGVLILEFSDRWVVCWEDGNWGLLPFEGTSQKYHEHSCIGDNIPWPKVLLMLNEKVGRSVDKETRPRQETQVGTSLSVSLI